MRATVRVAELPLYEVLFRGVREFRATVMGTVS